MQFEVNVCFLPIDEFQDDWASVSQRYKELFLNAKFSFVFDFLQFILSNEIKIHGYAEELKQIFSEHQSAYTIVNSGRVIAPVTTPTEALALENSLRAMNESGLSGAEKHLESAIKQINLGDFAGCIRESIHAVESVARKLDPASASSLKPALLRLKRETHINEQLLSGFEKIYAYTNSEQGIRHALLEEKIRADKNDALFMLGACASFCSYLIGKSRKMDAIDD